MKAAKPIVPVDIALIIISMENRDSAGSGRLFGENPRRFVLAS